MILAYMRACMQIVAARLTDHTSRTTSVLLLAALSWLMSLSRHVCTAGLLSEEDLTDKSDIVESGNQIILRMGMTAMAPSDLRLPKSPAPSLDCDAITWPMPPLPCKAERLSQEEIKKGARSEHPVSSRTSNDCLQVVPSSVLHAPLNLETPWS